MLSYCCGFFACWRGCYVTNTTLALPTEAGTQDLWSRETMIIVIVTIPTIIIRIRWTDYAPPPLPQREKNQLKKDGYIHIYEICIKNNDLEAKFYQNFNLNLMIIGAPAKPRLRFTKNHIKKCKIVHTSTKFSIQC